MRVGGGGGAGGAGAWVLLPPGMPSSMSRLIHALARKLRQSQEALLKPVVVSRNPGEKVLVEGSINSVRVSIKIKQVGAGGRAVAQPRVPTHTGTCAVASVRPTTLSGSCARSLRAL